MSESSLYLSITPVKSSGTLLCQAAAAIPVNLPTEARYRDPGRGRDHQGRQGAPGEHRVLEAGQGVPAQHRQDILAIQGTERWRRLVLPRQRAREEPFCASVATLGAQLHLLPQEHGGYRTSTESF